MPLRLFVLLFALLLTLQPAAAQPAADAHPLLQLLARVPDDSRLLGGTPTIGYIDYRAVEAARPGAGSYATAADFIADSEARTPEAGLWMAATMRIVTGSEIFAYAMRDADVMPAAVGFDLFDIDRVLVFGEPPSQAVFYAGDTLDLDAIAAALTARDYTARTDDDLIIWSHPDGRNVDLLNAEPARPFGGDLGRNDPVIGTDGLLMSSPDPDVMSALQNMRRSLAQSDDHRAAAAAITAGDGLLVQALYLNPLEVGMMPGDPAAMLFDPNASDAPDPLVDYGELPFYNLAVLADRHEDGDDVAVVALVYLDEATAEAAAAELAARIDALRLPLDAAETVNTMFDATLDPPQVIASDDRYVAVVTVRYPTPPQQPIDMMTGEVVDPDTFDGPTQYQASGRIFRGWVQGLFRREFLPLTISE